jgi:hypothetical protein
MQPPYNFGALQAFDIDLPTSGPAHVSLADFSPRGAYDANGVWFGKVPFWRISPQEIRWSDYDDYSDFVIDFGAFGASTIQADNDPPSPICPGTSGECIVHGTWTALVSGPPTAQMAGDPPGDPVPEPMSAALLGAGLVGLAIRRQFGGIATNARGRLAIDIGAVGCADAALA